MKVEVVVQISRVRDLKQFFEMSGTFVLRCNDSPADSSPPGGLPTETEPSRGGLTAFTEIGREFGKA
jgi:hypothetical protein